MGYPEYVSLNSWQERRIEEAQEGGAYLNKRFTDLVQSEVKSVFEIGSRDAIDALKLSQYYKCHVFCFECNPHTLTECEKNIGSNPNVTLIPQAVWDKSGEIPFYPIVEVEGVNYNPGASSCLLLNEEGYHGDYKQEEIVVPATRLDEWLDASKISHVDMLCIDVQGGALNVLKGLGEYLQKVKYIIVELELETFYHGEALYPEFDRFMNENGFFFCRGEGSNQDGDFFYVRKNHLCTWW